MKSKTIESLVRANIAALEPYSTARDEYEGALGVFLDANESPFNNGYNRKTLGYEKGYKFVGA